MPDYHRNRSAELAQAGVTVKWVVKSLKAVYKHLPLQRYVWDWLHVNLNASGLSLFVEFFVVSLNECELVQVSTASVTR